MQVFFYQLSRSPIEAALPRLARATLGAEQRLLVVAEEAALLDRISRGLWEWKGSFLAHGRAGAADQVRQPILLSHRPEPANGARYVALADGRWHDEALGFERAMLVFDTSTVSAARDQWKQLGTVDGIERRYYEQTESGWNQAA